MRSAKIALGLASALVAIGTALLGWQPAFADERGWVLTQKSDKIGDQYVYVAPTGVKLVNPKIGYNIILCAPDWNVCIFNDKTRTFYSASYDAWMKEVSQAVGGKGSELKGGHWVKGSVSSVAGLKATSYTMQAGRKGLRNATCWVSNEIIVPTQITELLAQTYGLPDNKAYPLKLNTVDSSGKLSVQLDTYNSQVCAIPASYFYLPNGYTRVASKEEVMVDDETKQILRDLAGDSPSMSGGAAPRQQQMTRQPVQQPNQTFLQQPQSQQQIQQGQAVQQRLNQATQAPPVTPTATPGTIVLPNGQTLDREKLLKIRDAILKGGK
ncbi:MAG: hypothetical protein KGS72_14615 [Cyanobacteria bacterium REEB67]|nr:hypothetical protein [Cyanobacteria bacterium REEB67]